MKVAISFVVQMGSTPNHHRDRRFEKTFDVEWVGRPAPGEPIELDVPAPISDHDFKVKGVWWGVNRPPLVYLEPVVLNDHEVEWDDGLEGYTGYLAKKGWRR